MNPPRISALAYDPDEWSIAYNETADLQRMEEFVTAGTRLRVPAPLMAQIFNLESARPFNVTWSHGQPQPVRGGGHRDTLALVLRSQTRGDSNGYQGEIAGMLYSSVRRGGYRWYRVRDRAWVGVHEGAIARQVGGRTNGPWQQRAIRVGLDMAMLATRRRANRIRRPVARRPAALARLAETKRRRYM